MLPALVTLSLLLTSAICIPVQPITTISPIAKRYAPGTIILESDNPDDPNSWKPISTVGVSGAQQTPAPQTPDTTTPTPQNTNTGSSDSGSNDILATINKWRSAYGKKSLSWSQEMLDAATNTGNLNGGGSIGMNHHAPGNAAEVIAPGSDNDDGQDLKGHSPFEITFIAWLCEVPSDSELGSACADQQSVMDIIQSGTGHHDILTDDSYGQIGCAFTKRPHPNGWYLSQGQWTCDLTN